MNVDDIEADAANADAADADAVVVPQQQHIQPLHLKVKVRFNEECRDIETNRGREDLR